LDFLEAKYRSMVQLAWDGVGCQGNNREVVVKRIAIVWPGLTGYLGPCWQALARVSELRVFIDPSPFDQGFPSPDGVDIVKGASVAEVKQFHPDLIIVCGWSTSLCRAVGFARMPGRKVLALDMPWEWRLRKIVARFVLWPYLREFEYVFVPGRAARRYAEWLGFRGRIVEGSNPSGIERFGMMNKPQPYWIKGDRTGFVFIGRNAPEKGVTILQAAYDYYRTRVSHPWSLEIIGGENFVNPEELPKKLVEKACCVLPSLREPWGVVVAEAMSAGLATIVSDRCGITLDVAPTVCVKSGDVEALAAAMEYVHNMGTAALQSEACRVCCAMLEYSVEKWLARVESLGEF
ncbi:MAG: glycosyltransferase family 4 protein, partial [Kiritimatiellia bacterium]